MGHLLKQILRPLEKCPNTWNFFFNEYNDENPQIFNLILALKRYIIVKNLWVNGKKTP